MDKTVQLDKKLIVLTPNTPVASKEGLMITPPPIPHIAPITDARKLTNKKTKLINIITSSLAL